jgi:hypothetical protein
MVRRPVKSAFGAIEMSLKKLSLQSHIVVALAFSLLTVGEPPRAMTFRNEIMVCPYDGTTFQFTGQSSGTVFDKTLDWMPYGPIQSPWPLAVCPTNGFVFAKRHYTDEELEKLRPLILSPEYQAMRQESPHFRLAWLWNGRANRMTRCRLFCCRRRGRPLEHLPSGMFDMPRN